MVFLGRRFILGFFSSWTTRGVTSQLSYINVGSQTWWIRSYRDVMPKGFPVANGNATGSIDPNDIPVKLPDFYDNSHLVPFLYTRL